MSPRRHREDKHRSALKNETLVRRRLRRARECAVELHRTRKLVGVPEEEEEEMACVTTTRGAVRSERDDAAVQQQSERGGAAEAQQQSAAEMQDNAPAQGDDAWEVVRARSGWLRRLAAALHLV